MRWKLSLFIILGFFAWQLGSTASTVEAKPMDSDKKQMIEAREKFFGKEHVNHKTGAIRKDKVILSWFGVSNFAAAINGHVVLLDSWVPRGTYTGYVPTSPDELAQLKPEAIFIGHAHFDHAADAAEIISKSGAKLVGTPEHCAYIKGQVEEDVDVSCIHAVPEDAEIGTTSKLSFLKGVEIKAVKHVHSDLLPNDLSDPSKPLLTVTDLSYAVEHPAKPKEFRKLLSSALTDEEGGSLLYQFKVGKFNLTWNDSAGPIKEEAPELTNVLGALSKPDVQVGAIMGFNQFTNGLRDPRMYIEALQPKVFVPTHHDNWAPPITTKGTNYQEALETELERLPKSKRPKLRFISDPEDYVKPEKLTFSINDRKWK
ncbi:MBL fold metallo-hydrolase [Peribacillus sp. NPDC097295]|uniref:MBL fold metallo-hydrolase n=1 Tax=Peribacillus sp. NPDC097295 TaxID=3364402 RepID=UPI0037F6503F